MAKTLQLNFTTENGKNVTLTVDEPRADLTAPAVEAAMQAIIASGIFEVDDYPLEAIKSARIIERDVTELLIME
ncbi:DUF2922 domain-containing protein [Sporosarcina pasteurii]|uniref:Protein of uncharacterized function (DUF2922) n=1 Tax=Sporosarcina pasteurii TaxID=1474 RepID=A0A380BD53_SPOPA|nr:DUF2922 domain-containing protein [Sporosarcina pasteurii]MDS9472601.1 DUF2922 domain-containing protein [Sporosarcina pasteurii]QBQ06149.1 DUF2922 domain-containing protein [Sporosarcina pasteurii]SUI99326.1 Protein of uncharacterised function (DUF2922) [Sporosarcina pasteurii]